MHTLSYRASCIFTRKEKIQSYKIVKTRELADDWPACSVCQSTPWTRPAAWVSQCSMHIGGHPSRWRPRCEHCGSPPLPGSTQGACEPKSTRVTESRTIPVSLSEPSLMSPSEKPPRCLLSHPTEKFGAQIVSYQKELTSHGNSPLV